MNMNLYLFFLLFFLLGVSESRCLYEDSDNDPAKDGKDCAKRKITYEEIKDRDDKEVSNWKCCFIKERVSLDNGESYWWTYCDPFKEEWITILKKTQPALLFDGECLDPVESHYHYYKINILLLMILFIIIS